MSSSSASYNKLLISAGASASLAFVVLRWLRREVTPFWRTRKELIELSKLDFDSDKLVKNGFTNQKVLQLGAVDVIVIGSGLSGLTVAAMLARHGRKVLVLEQHDQAGGNCHTFPKKCEHNGETVEFEFDTGVHYLGGCLDNSTAPMRKLYDFVTGCLVTWGRLDDVYDVAVCTGEGKVPRETFEFSADFAKTEKDLSQRFTSLERKAIRKFFRELTWTTGPAVVGWFVWKLGGPKFFATQFLRYARRTTRDFLMSVSGMTPKLLGVLTYCFGDHGLQPGQSSWVIQALISKHYEGGAFFPEGGPSRIAKAAVAVINKCGGAVMVRAPVSTILTNNGSVCGVRMARSGFEIHSKCVVSAAGVRNTYLKLLTARDQEQVGPILEALRMHYDGLKSGLEPSVCMVCLFVGLDADDESLKLPRANYWRFPSWDHDANMEAFFRDSTLPIPGVFVSTSSSKDADWSRRHPGVSTVQVLAPVNYDWFYKYERTKFQNRGEEYIKYKEQWTKRLLDHLYDQFPQVEGHVIFTELGTPLTNNYFMATDEGEVYGIAHTPQRYSDWQEDLNPATRFKGLYLTGQDIFCDGVGAALVAGALTAFRVSPSLALRNFGLFM